MGRELIRHKASRIIRTGSHEAPTGFFAHTTGIEIKLIYAYTLLLKAIYFYSLFAVGNLPGGEKNQSGYLFDLVEIDFIHVVGGLVVVFVYAIEVEDHRHLVFSEVIVIRPVVESVRIGRVIVGIIELQVREFPVSLVAEYMGHGDSRVTEKMYVHRNSAKTALALDAVRSSRTLSSRAG